jgi:hypothetical protein
MADNPIKGSHAMGRPLKENTARHIISRALKDAGRAIKATGQPTSLSPEYLTKLRLMCLRQAQAHLPTSTPDEVVRDAEQRFRNCLSFLTGAQS